MRILIVCPSLPYPPDKGATIRTFTLMRHLALRHEIDLVCIENDLSDAKYVRELEKYCERVYLAPRKKVSKIFQLPKVLGRFLRGEPFRIKYTESRELGKLLHEITGKRHYDIIQFEHSETAQNLKFLCPQHKAKTVLSMHNITCLQFYRIYKTEKKMCEKIKHFLTWFPMMSWEPKMARLFDKLIVVSDVDRILLQVLEPSLDISVIPNGVDTKTHRPYSLEEREKNILIVGSMDYEPNGDAVKYFHNEVFPRIRKRIPDCTLTIVGNSPSNEIQQLDAEQGVMVRANVDDVRPYYRRARVSAVALRSGGGTRLKILESMALGTPVVSTLIGCEGLDVQDDLDILIANDPVEFTEKITELMLSPDLWNRISKEARSLVESKYNWAYICELLENIYRELVTGPVTHAKGKEAVVHD